MEMLCSSKKYIEKYIENVYLMKNTKSRNQKKRISTKQRKERQQPCLNNNNKIFFLINDNASN